MIPPLAISAGQRATGPPGGPFPLRSLSPIEENFTRLFVHPRHRIFRSKQRLVRQPLTMLILGRSATRLTLHSQATSMHTTRPVR
jgi:hypothetical protein